MVVDRLISVRKSSVVLVDAVGYYITMYDICVTYQTVFQGQLVVDINMLESRKHCYNQT